MTKWVLPAFTMACMSLASSMGSEVVSEEGISSSKIRLDTVPNKLTALPERDRSSYNKVAVVVFPLVPVMPITCKRCHGSPAKA